MNYSLETAPRCHLISFLILMMPLVFLTSSCMVGPKYQRPSAPVPQTYKEAPPSASKKRRVGSAGETERHNHSR